jgi:hypothetical protein
LKVISRQAGVSMEDHKQCCLNLRWAHNRHGRIQIHDVQDSVYPYDSRRRACEPSHSTDTGRVYARC